MKKSKKKIVVACGMVLLVGIACASAFFLFNKQSTESDDEKIKNLEAMIAVVADDSKKLQDELFKIFQEEGFSENYYKKAEEISKKEEQQIELLQEKESISEDALKEKDASTDGDIEVSAYNEKDEMSHDKYKVYSYRSNSESYKKSFSIPSISYAQFLSGSSNYSNITTYYEDIKTDLATRIGAIGNVKEDCSNINVDFYLIRDDNGDLLKDGEALKANANAAMLYNTYVLQNVINCTSNYGKQGAKIILPKGTYYFANGHTLLSNDKDVLAALAKSGTGKKMEKENHIIKPRNNIYLKGYSNNEDGANTTLKPFTNKNYTTDAAPDMFFYNDYRASNFTYRHYLENNRYEDFIIDGEKATGTGYSTAGKGFMYNLFKDTDWNYVTVKNTDGTGFGVDAPINSLINKSRAVGCGKGLKDPTTNSGASGFGIGVGLSDQETMNITNSEAVGNRLFGIFFEHQNRFGPNYYTAKVGKFEVSNTISSGNWYNYGGYRAYNLKYKSNNISKIGCVTLNRRYITAKQSTLGPDNISCTKHSVYFDDHSRNVEANGITTEYVSDSKRSTYFSDIPENSAFSAATNWATNRSFVYEAGYAVTPKQPGKEEIQLSFKPNDGITRANAMLLLWRYSGRPGLVASKSNSSTIDLSNGKRQIVTTCFKDVASDSYYAPAIKWAYEKSPRITNGKVDCVNGKNGVFASNDIITRAEFITFLWRMDGGKEVSGNVKSFSDVPKNSWYYKAVRWAISNGVTNGTSSDKFSPNQTCTRGQALIMLCRYAGKCPKV